MRGSVGRHARLGATWVVKVLTCRDARAKTTQRRDARILHARCPQTQRLHPVLRAKSWSEKPSLASYSWGWRY
jgi:hypothetical protein